MTQGKKLPKRDEIDEQYKWNVGHIYENIAAWEQDFQWVKENAKAIQDYVGRVGESADTLYKVLDLEDKIFMRLEKVYTYAHLRHDEDTTHSTYKGLYDRACGLYAQIGSMFSFVTPEILTVPEETIEKYVNENPELQVYRYALQLLNEKRPHILGAKEEKILAQASEIFAAPGQIFSTLNNSDLKFPMIEDEDGKKIEVTHGR